MLSRKFSNTNRILKSPNVNDDLNGHVSDGHVRGKNDGMINLNGLRCEVNENVYNGNVNSEVEKYPQRIHKNRMMDLNKRILDENMLKGDYRDIDRDASNGAKTNMSISQIDMEDNYKLMESLNYNSTGKRQNLNAKQEKKKNVKNAEKKKIESGVIENFDQEDDTDDVTSGSEVENLDVEKIDLNEISKYKMQNGIEMLRGKGNVYHVPEQVLVENNTFASTGQVVMEGLRRHANGDLTHESKSKVRDDEQPTNASELIEFKRYGYTGVLLERYSCLLYMLEKGYLISEMTDYHLWYFNKKCDDCNISTMCVIDLMDKYGMIFLNRLMEGDSGITECMKDPRFKKRFVRGG